MLPLSVRVKLENLAEMTGWGVSTLREAARKGELGVKRRGQWVASFEDYNNWLNAETRQQRRDDKENPLGKVEGGGNGRGQVDKRAERGAKGGRVAKAQREDRPTVIYELDRERLGGGAAGQARGDR